MNDDEDEVNQDADDIQDQFNTFAALQHIARFDEILGKTCRICCLDELDIEERQKCWFHVLRYLQNYYTLAE